MGWAFKKNTNDSRESAAIYVANNLLSKNIAIDIYDKKINEFQCNSDISSLNPNYNKSLVNVLEDPFENISDYNTIAIMTEWDEFKDFDWEMIYNKVKKPAYIFDGRNILNIEKIKMIGFNYEGIGRK